MTEAELKEVAETLTNSLDRDLPVYDLARDLLDEVKRLRALVTPARMLAEKVFNLACTVEAGAGPLPVVEVRDSDWDELVKLATEALK